jgi:flagellar biosynthesis/type III secretory pathway ATPase
MALYAEIEDMVTIGAYQGGGSEYDLAVKAMPLIRAFLDQPIERREDFDDTVAALKELCRRIARMRQGGAGAAT